jgi:hypothetical protein
MTNNTRSMLAVDGRIRFQFGDQEAISTKEEARRIAFEVLSSIYGIRTSHLVKLVSQASGKKT